MDEVTLKRLKKETRFGTIVLGNGVIDYVKVKCTKCNSIFNDFDLQYSKILKEVMPTCPSCGVDILESEFLPLDKSNKVIK
jgi:hypothetical protein